MIGWYKFYYLLDYLGVIASSFEGSSDVSGLSISNQFVSQNCMTRFSPFAGTFNLVQDDLQASKSHKNGYSIIKR